MDSHVISRVKKGIYPDHFGLANQLFQIAAVYAYAKRNGITATFPDLTNTERNGPYLDTIFRNIETGHSDMVSRCLDEGRVYYEPTFIYTEIPEGMRDFLVDGYFQSEKYFSDCSDDIQKLFSIDEQSKNTINELTKDIEDGWATLHIRRGDYLDFPDVFVDLCSTNYYRRAVDMLESDIVYIATNKKDWSEEWVDKNLPKDKEYRWSNSSDIIDLYLMSMAKECIIANSSFSWWGSWLGANKKTIAPRNWFCEGHDATAEDIYHSNCTIIDTDIG